jgi:hypothetical protein
MEIEDVVGVKFGIENEVDMEEKRRGWDLEDIAGDSLRLGPMQEPAKCCAFQYWIPSQNGIMCC